MRRVPTPKRAAELLGRYGVPESEVWGHPGDSDGAEGGGVSTQARVFQRDLEGPSARSPEPGPPKNVSTKWRQSPLYKRCSSIYGDLLGLEDRIGGVKVS